MQRELPSPGAPAPQTRQQYSAGPTVGPRPTPLPTALTSVDLLLDGHEAGVGKDLLQPAAVHHVGVRAEEGARAAEGGCARQGRAVVAVMPQHDNVPVVCGAGQRRWVGGWVGGGRGVWVCVGVCGWGGVGCGGGGGGSMRAVHRGQVGEIEVKRARAERGRVQDGAAGEAQH